MVQQEVSDMTEGDQTTLQVPLGKPFQIVAIHLESRVLLLTNHEDLKYAVSVSSEQDLGHAKLCLEPVHKPKRNATVNQWSTTFNTLTVYSIKHPSLTPALLKYCELVRDLANR